MFDKGSKIPIILEWLKENKAEVIGMVQGWVDEYYTKPRELLNVMFCAIWHYLFNLKTWKTPMEECFTKSNIPPWVFFMFFKL